MSIQNEITNLKTLTEQNGELVKQNRELSYSLTQATQQDAIIGKKNIVELLNECGVDASISDSLAIIAEKIKLIPVITSDTVVADFVPRPLNLSYFIASAGHGIVEARDDEVTYLRSLTGAQKTLKSIYFPNLENVDMNNGFKNLTYLENVYLPKVKNVNFEKCSSIKTLSLPEALTVYAGSCVALIDLYIPKATEVYINGCSNLEVLNAPEFYKNTANGYTGDELRACTKLREAHLPKLIKTGSNTFYGDAALEILDITNIETIGNNNFYNVTKLIDLHIGAGFASNINMNSAAYNPKVAYSKTDSSLCYATDISKYGRTFDTNWEKWKYCILNYFAANLQDRTGLTSYTITFGSAVLPLFDEEMIEAFTSKNWTLA